MIGFYTIMHQGPSPGKDDALGKNFDCCFLFCACDNFILKKKTKKKNSCDAKEKQTTTSTHLALGGDIMHALGTCAMSWWWKCLVASQGAWCMLLFFLFFKKNQKSVFVGYVNLKLMNKSVWLPYSTATLETVQHKVILHKRASPPWACYLHIRLFAGTPTVIISIFRRSTSVILTIGF